VVVGVRPEHFQGIDQGVPLSLTIDMLEHLGGETFAYARHGQGKHVIIKMRDGRQHKPGMDIEARFDPSRALLFDCQGARIS
jgi:lactose/L-arabinose transport system ATP-binding protein